MAMIAFILSSLISLYLFVLIVWIISGWLITFGIINRSNVIVAYIMDFCGALAETGLRPIRSLIPPINGIDISPIFLFIGLQAVQIYILQPMARGA